MLPVVEVGIKLMNNRFKPEADSHSDFKIKTINVYNVMMKFD